MPNQRASGQSLVGCHLDAEFLAAIDQARGGKSRSQFLREALHGHLLERGYKVPDKLMDAPDRAGKGGPRKRVRYKTKEEERKDQK